MHNYHYSQIESQQVKWAFSVQKNAGMDNIPRVSCWRRIPAEWSPRAVHDMDLEFLGSAHGVPIEKLLLRCWAMPARESNSLLQLAHMKPNDSGNCFGPQGCLPPAPRRMLWIAFNLLQFPSSGPINANCSETGTKLNTKNKCTTLCIATDGLFAWMYTHHEINENYIIKCLIQNYRWLRDALHTHRKHNARSRWMRNIWTLKQLPNNCWANFNNLLRAGRHLVQQHGDQEPAVEKAVALQLSGLWCAWICSRITKNYFCPIMMRRISDCCFAPVCGVGAGRTRVRCKDQILSFCTTGLQKPSLKKNV